MKSCLETAHQIVIESRDLFLDTSFVASVLQDLISYAVLSLILKVVFLGKKKEHLHKNTKCSVVYCAKYELKIST